MASLKRVIPGDCLSFVGSLQHEHPLYQHLSANQEKRPRHRSTEEAVNSYAKPCDIISLLSSSSKTLPGLSKPLTTVTLLH